MQPVIRPLLLLHSSPELRETLAEVPGQLYRLMELPDWAALHEALKRAPLTAIVVVDPLGPDGVLTEELRDLLREFPSATVLAALAVTPGDGELLQTLLDWGVADFVVMGHETTPLGLARRIRLVRSRTMKRLLERALPQGVPGRAQGMLIRAAEVVAVGGGAPELAAALRVSPRTVPRWCERADLPPPRRLFAWLRLLLAAEMLEQPRRSLASVARACGYANESSLKNTLRDFLGIGATELRRAGAFQAVAGAFARDLATVREHAHAAGKSRNVWLN